MARHRIAWQSSIDVGHEWCELDDGPVSPGLHGTVVVVAAGVPWRITYAIALDDAGRTRHLRVDAEGPDSPVAIDLTADGAGRWVHTATDEVFVDDPAALDVDLGFSPSTNTLPIRRLGLAVGETREIAVVWILFPAFEIVLGRQSYERLDDRLWRYRSTGFTGDLVVDGAGLVETYAEWTAVARTTLE
jgi:hypothetical protein